MFWHVLTSGNSESHVSDANVRSCVQFCYFFSIYMKFPVSTHSEVFRHLISLYSSDHSNFCKGNVPTISHRIPSEKHCEGHLLILSLHWQPWERKARLRSKINCTASSHHLPPSATVILSTHQRLNSKGLPMPQDKSLIPACDNNRRGIVLNAGWGEMKGTDSTGIGHMLEKHDAKGFEGSYAVPGRRDSC